MASDSDIVKDLLLEDYRYRAEAMKNSEQTGETRINLFIGFATIVVGALVSLSTQEHGPKGDALKLIALLVLFALIVLGCMTLLRLLIRNERTDECKRDLDYIRQMVKDHFDDDGLLIGYYPVGGPKANHPPVPRLKHRSRHYGGLTHLMSGTNSLLLALLAVCLIVPFQTDFSFSSPQSWRLLITAGLVAILVFIFSLVGQNVYIDRRDRQAKAMRQATMPTHAGGVIYQTNGEQVQYLIIQPKQADSGKWVLPKGHINKGEGHLEAALRAAIEETSAMTRPVCFLDMVEYEVQCHRIRAKFYLLEWLFDTPMPMAPVEDPSKQWLTFEQAIDRLKNPEDKYLLQLADHKRKRFAPSNLNNQLQTENAAVTPTQL